jgi:hypothetical protein
VKDGAGSWCVEEPGPCRRGRRSPGDRTVPGGPGGAGRRAGAALAGTPGHTAGRSAAPAGGRGRRPAPAGVHRSAAGHPGAPAPRGVPRRTGVPVRSVPLADHPGDRRGAPAAGRARLHRRGRSSAAHSGRRAPPTWAPAGRWPCWMPPRCGCAARPPVGPVDTGWSPARPGLPPPRALVLTDTDGRLLFCGQSRPGSIHDLTQVRQGRPGRTAGPHARRHPAGRSQLPGPERADRRRGPHAAAGPAQEPAAGPARPLPRRTRPSAEPTPPSGSA